MITGDLIPLYRYIVMARVLKLEMLGLRSSKGRTCYAIVKSELGYKGNRAKVLAQLEAHIEALKEALDAASNMEVTDND